MAASSSTPTSRIFIRGLPPSITEPELRKHLATIRGASGGDVTDVKLIPQRRIGYVGYKNPEDAAKAVKYFNKSYVRMSKISVEPAKAISDPSLTKSRGRDRDVGSGTGPSSAKRKSPEDNAEENAVSKRRKGEETRSDPKLTEFLEVMGSAKESALAKGPTDEPEMAQVDVPEGESDDEYEQIPSKRDIPKKVEPPSKPQPSRALPTVSKAAEKEKRDTEEDQSKADPGAEEDPEALEDAPAPAATDDDWLRSRTNRLLDLVDPDELPKEQAKVSKSSQPPRVEEASAEESQDETPHHQALQQMEVDEPEQVEGESTLDTIRRTSRLFVRNLPYGATKEDIADSFEKFGTISEIHIPASKAGTSKGFCFIVFAESSDAVGAFQSMDGATFQGRIIHIIPASGKRGDELDEFEISKLPLKKQNLIRKRQKAASTTFNWNSLYMNQDAVNESVANRLGVSKSELLDPTSSDAAVKQAIAETSVIQDTKAYFVANGVDIDAFKSHRRGDTAILVKNFPYGTTIEELRTLFEESGPVLKVLMPPSGTIAIVLFAQANHAKTAFERLAYRRMKSSMLFLEKAPRDLFPGETSGQAPASDRPTGTAKLNANELLSGGDNAGLDEVVDTTSLFVRNLNFDTTTSGLADACSSLDGFVSARVKTKSDPKKPGKTLSMGFGFVEFRSKEQAHEALQILNGYVLDGHTLTVKASHRGLDAAEERKRDDKAKKAAGQRTKIIIKNLPFQASKKDIRALFGTYGQLRSVRVPKKMDHTARGFAFADFVTPREAENALNSLKDTHLLGRKLVLDFAEAEAVDAEEEIEKMQRKVGGQANKMALQQLTGKGRQKVNIGDNNEDEFEG